MGNTVTGAQVVAEAKKFVGIPYVWGEETPKKGFTCSALVQYVFAQLGVQVPRTTYTQVKAGRSVNPNTASPGDLLFFEGSDPGQTGAPGHVGIFVGGTYMIDAPETGEDVKYDRVTWRQVVAVRQVTTGHTSTPAPDKAPTTGKPTPYVPQPSTTCGSGAFFLNGCQLQALKGGALVVAGGAVLLFAGVLLLRHGLNQNIPLPALPAVGGSSGSSEGEAAGAAEGGELAEVAEVAAV
jgi:hypothetical protein